MNSPHVANTNCEHWQQYPLKRAIATAKTT